MTQRKKLIEVALPLEAINVASAREKSIRHGHPSTLHLWWARRPLAAARAVIFTSLVDDPDDPNALPAFVEACKQLPKGKNVEANGDTPRMRLFDFIERLVTWEATTDEAILNTARELIQIATEGNPPPLLDPFAGGGSIPLEAQRLGLEAHASDLNPVAVMINKAQIEIPPRFANRPPVNPRDRQRMNSGEGWKGAAGLAADVRYYGEWMREKAWERIGHLYPTHNGETVIAWLWARTVKSPNPAVNAHVPLVRSFILSKKKGKECWAKPIIEGQTVRFEVTQGLPPKGQEGTMGRGGGTCIVSGEPITWEYIRSEGQARRMSTMLMAIITEGNNSQNFYTAPISHQQTAQSANPKWSPDLELSQHPQYMAAPRYGLTNLSNLFTPRQIVALTTFSDLVSEGLAQAHNDAILAGMASDQSSLGAGGQGALAYAEAIGVYLAFAVDRGANYWSSLTTWGGGFIVQTFGMQTVSMVWDYTEANPFSDSTGNWLGAINWIQKCIENLPAILDGVAIQQDATQLDHTTKVVSTDPPYYDNVPYSDLADFFYGWLRYPLRKIYPEIFGTLVTPKIPELVADAQRHNGRENADHHFESGMLQTFTNIRRFITSEFPLTVYYAFKQQDSEIIDEDNSNVGLRSAPTSTGWETMLSSLIEAGFSVDGTWPIRTERGGGFRNLNRNSLASSIVLVCRPRPEDAPTTSRRAFVDALRRELPAALKAMQSGNIAPVDLAQASIGPGMAIYSRYSKVLEADGYPMSVRTALGLINAALDEYLAEQDGDIDTDTRFAIAWFTEYGFETGEYGRAETLATAKNVSVSGIERAGIVQSGRNKVRLLHWKEYDPGAWDPTQDKRPTVWEATHHLIERLNSHGETGSALLMQKMPSDMAAEARQLAYRLYSICERKGWAEHARDYNALVISWSGIGEEAARLRQAAESGDATTQERLFE